MSKLTELYTTQKILQNSFDTNGFLNVQLVNSSGNVIPTYIHGIGVINQPYLYAIAEGIISNHEVFRKSGYNSDIDNTLEDIWDVGGLYTFPTASMQMEVVSTSANDSALGIGARKVEIHYLDNTYTSHSESVTLSGVTPVPTTATNIFRVNEFHLLEVGSSGSAAGANGNIDLRHLNNTPIYARIVAGFNACQSCIYTVPIDRTLYLTSWNFAAGASAANHYTQGRLEMTVNNVDQVLRGVFITQDITIAVDNGTRHVFEVPIQVPPTADLKVSAISDSSSSNVNVASSLEGWFEINE